MANKQMKTLTIGSFTYDIVDAEARSQKIDKIEGKGLSTNDYDNIEKQKVSDAYNAIDLLQNKNLEIEKQLSSVSKIAKGRNTGYVFETVETMTKWLRQVNEHNGGFVIYETRIPYLGNLGIEDISNPKAPLKPNPNIAICLQTLKPSADYSSWNLPNYTYFYIFSESAFYFLTDGTLNNFIGGSSEPEEPIYSNVTLIQHVDVLLGDNFYIVKKEVPDYWYGEKHPDGSELEALGAFELETQKVDLSEYITNSNLDRTLASLITGSSLTEEKLDKKYLPIDTELGLKSLDIRNIEQGKYNFYPNTEATAEKLTTLDLTDIYTKLGQVENSIQNLNEALEKYGTLGGNVV